MAGKAGTSKGVVKDEVTAACQDPADCGNEMGVYSMDDEKPLKGLEQGSDVITFVGSKDTSHMVM